MDNDTRLAERMRHATGHCSKCQPLSGSHSLWRMPEPAWRKYGLGELQMGNRGMAVLMWRNQLKKLIGLLFIMSALAAAFFGVRAREGEAGPRWSWDAAVPGERDALTASDRLLARLSGVDAATVRRVASVNDLKLLAGKKGDDVCFAAAAPTWSRQYECVPTLPHPVYLTVTASGHGDEVHRQELIGVARNDVSSVAVSLRAGGERRLPLGKWRQFRYSATSERELPAVIRVYSSTGLIHEEQLRAVAP